MLVCENSLYGYSHYHLSCSQGDVVSAFSIWDDRE